MIFRLSLLFMLLTLCSITLNAEEETAEELSYIEFMEFLGEWETSDGEWIDPAELEKDIYAELEKEIPAENESEDETVTQKSD